MPYENRPRAPGRIDELLHEQGEIYLAARYWYAAGTAGERKADPDTWWSPQNKELPRHDFPFTHTFRHTPYENRPLVPSRIDELLREQGETYRAARYWYTAGAAAERKADPDTWRSPQDRDLPRYDFPLPRTFRQ